MISLVKNHDALVVGSFLRNYQAIDNATGIRVRNDPITLDKLIDQLPAIV
jgi:hypothetical protein